MDNSLHAHLSGLTQDIMRALQIGPINALGISSMGGHQRCHMHYAIAALEGLTHRSCVTYIANGVMLNHPRPEHTLHFIYTTNQKAHFQSRVQQRHYCVVTDKPGPTCYHYSHITSLGYKGLAAV
jgi:hypothetical protein